MAASSFNPALLSVPPPAPTSPSTVVSKMFSQLSEGSTPGKPHVLYPDGVLAVLALLGLGTSGAPEIVAKTLFGGDEGMISFNQRIKALAGPEIKSENAIFLSDKEQYINQVFLEQVKSLATFGSVDFASSSTIQMINKWIQNQSGFVDLLQGDFSRTFLIAINTLWFKDTWVHKFRSDLTREEDFQLASGEVVKLPTMMQFNDKLEFFQDGHISAVRLPFTHGANAEFVLGLPPSAAIENNYPYGNQNQMDVRLYVPKFRAEDNKIDLIPLATAGGFKDLFVPGSFGRMLVPEAQGRAYITSFFQAIVVTFDEEGAEVRAATVAGLMRTAIAMPKPFVEIRFNRPFHYRITKGDSTLVQGYFTGSG